MQKDNVRDYATSAFRLYAAMGRPTYDEATQDIYNKAIADCGLKDPEMAVSIAEAAVNQASPLLLDILAAEKTLDILERGGKAHIVRAVEDVYFVQPTQPLRRGDITARVNRHSIMTPTSVPSVYRCLKEARMLFAAIRGLRLPAGWEKYKVDSSAV